MNVSNMYIFHVVRFFKKVKNLYIDQSFITSAIDLLYIYMIYMALFSQFIYKTTIAYCYCCCKITSVVSDSVRPHRRQLTRLPRLWDSPGKNTGGGCHFLLQCMIVKSESEVAQSCPTLSDPMDCSFPGSSVHGIFQARVLEWGAIAFSKIILSFLHLTFDNA